MKEAPPLYTVVGHLGPAINNLETTAAETAAAMRI